MSWLNTLPQMLMWLSSERGRIGDPAVAGQPTHRAGKGWPAARRKAATVGLIPRAARIFRCHHYHYYAGSAPTPEAGAGSDPRSTHLLRKEAAYEHQS